MLTLLIVLLLLVLLCGGYAGRGYWGGAPAAYGGPVSLVGLLLFVVLIVLLFRYL